MGAIYRVDKPSTYQGKQKFKVTKIIVHESNNKPKGMKYYDVALLKLESPATTNESVDPKHMSFHLLVHYSFFTRISGPEEKP